MATVNCAVNKGDTPINITWTLNDRPLRMYNGITVSHVNRRISTVTIESVHADHVGNYSCTATNKAGSVSHTAALLVNGSTL